jgi:hypothetical protein
MAKPTFASPAALGALVSCTNRSFIKNDDCPLKPLIMLVNRNSKGLSGQPAL